MVGEISDGSLGLRGTSSSISLVLTITTCCLPTAQKYSVFESRYTQVSVYFNTQNVSSCPSLKSCEVTPARQSRVAQGIALSFRSNGKVSFRPVAIIVTTPDTFSVLHARLAALSGQSTCRGSRTFGSLLFEALAGSRIVKLPERRSSYHFLCFLTQELLLTILSRDDRTTTL
jgi:hypothetical protein